MQSSVQQISIFVASVAGASSALGFGLRLLTRRGSARDVRCPESMSLTDAARFAYNRAKAERLPIANVADFNNTSSGAIRWFFDSIRHILRLDGADGEQRVTRAQIRRYFRWARAVQ
jgi:hypothetical protein